VPKAEQEKAPKPTSRFLSAPCSEANQLARERAGLKPAQVDEPTMQFVRDSLNAINDSFFYGSPVYLQLDGYDEVLSSGLQLTARPART